MAEHKSTKLKLSTHTSVGVHCILLYTTSGFHALLGNRTSRKVLSLFSTMRTMYLLVFNISSTLIERNFAFKTSPTRTCVVPEGTFLDCTHILSTCHHCGSGWWSGVMLPWKVECLTKMLRITVAIYVWISENMKVNKCKIATKNVWRAKSTTGQVSGRLTRLPTSMKCVFIAFTAFGRCLGLRLRNRGSILTIGIQVLIVYREHTQSALDDWQHIQR